MASIESGPQTLHFDDGAHFLSLTDPEPVNTALQELFEALA
jgi:hypothetical protein